MKKPQALTGADLDLRAALHEQLAQARAVYAAHLDDDAPTEIMSAAIADIQHIQKSLEALP